MWSNKHKRAFIETVLLGFPFPEIYIAAGEVDSQTGEGAEMLVDGQQRVTTLFQYFTGSEDLNLGSQIAPYRSLREEEKLAFLEYEVVVRDLGKKSISEIIEIFERINSTKYSLNAMEVHNARFDGEFKNFGEAIAQDAFFEQNRVFRTTEVRRMSDTRFALTFIISIMSAYFNRDSLLEEYLDKYNDEFEERDEFEAEIRKVLTYIEKLSLGQSSRAWKKADLLTLLVEVHAGLEKRHDLADAVTVSARVKSFYDRVDGVSDEEEDTDVLAYHKSAIQASNDRSSRVTRGRVLSRVLTGDWPAKKKG